MIPKLEGYNAYRNKLALCCFSLNNMMPLEESRHCTARQSFSTNCEQFQMRQLLWPLRIAAELLSKWQRTLLATLLIGTGITPLLPSHALTQQASSVGLGTYLNFYIFKPDLPPAASMAPAITHLIRGIIVDDKNETLPGAIILLEKTNTGVSTDADGKFTLPVTVTGKQIILRVKCLGYKPVKRRLFISAIPETLTIKLEIDENAADGWNGVY